MHGFQLENLSKSSSWRELRTKHLSPAVVVEDIDFLNMLKDN